MKPAVVTIKKSIKIMESESNKDLLSLYDSVIDQLRNRGKRDYNILDFQMRQLLLGDLNIDCKSTFDNYLRKDESTPIRYNKINITKIFTNSDMVDGFIEIEMISNEYTLLDSIDNKLLLKEDDIRDKLFSYIPITDAFFMELTSDVKFNTYLTWRNN